MQSISKQVELIRRHKQAVATKEELAKAIHKSQDDEDKMIAEWLAKNEPSVKIEHGLPFPHLEQQRYSNVKIY